MLATLLIAALAAVSAQANPLKLRDSTTAINGGGGTCAAPQEVRGPVEGYGACDGITDGCCKLRLVDENHSYSWWALLTSGDHGTMQVFSDEACSQDGSPVVKWSEGACVDTNNSGKIIRSIRVG